MSESNFQKALIGAALAPYDSQLEKIIEAGITREDFTGTARQVWAELEAMFCAGRAVNLLTVTEGLAGRVEPQYIESCLDTCPSAAFTPHNIELVRRETLLRRGRALLLGVEAAIQSATTDNAEAVIADIQTRWFDLAIPRDESLKLHEHMGEFIRQCGEGTAGVVPWFLPVIQNRYGKLTEEFIVIHAQPSVGKTAFIIQWITYLHRNGFKAAFASLESSARGIAPRFLSHIGEINALHMKTGHTSAEMSRRAANAVEEARQLGFVIRDGNMTDGQLAAWCRIQKQAGAQIIFIDNLRHIDSAQRYQDETRKFMEVSLSVKRIRDQLHIPVVLLHHSNEAGDVSWCKDIKKDADILLHLNRCGSRDNDTDEVDLVFQKGRDSGEFAIPALFHKSVQTFAGRRPF